MNFIRQKMTNTYSGKRQTKWLLLTVRFGATAAVRPQKILCGIERLSPATKVVEAATAPSRHPVICNAA